MILWKIRKKRASLKSPFPRFQEKIPPKRKRSPLPKEDLRAVLIQTFVSSIPLRFSSFAFTLFITSATAAISGHSVVSIMLDGYKVATPVGHRGEMLTTEIIAAFLPAFVVESLCSAIDRAGLTAAGLTLEPIAAMNVIVPPDLRLINIALCDIGAGTSDVAISRDGSVVAYGMATVAGDEVTEDLMKRLLVDFQTAERIKSCTDEQMTYTDILLAEHTVTDRELTELLAPSAETLAETIAAEILKANLIRLPSMIISAGFAGVP